MLPKPSKYAFVTSQLDYCNAFYLGLLLTTQMTSAGARPGTFLVEHRSQLPVLKDLSESPGTLSIECGRMM